MDNLFSLNHKLALVSGASSGLGAHFTQVLARAGCEVILAARRQDKLNHVVDLIHESGGKAHAITMDVTSPTSVARAFETLDRQFGPLDLLINNAGISSTPTKFLDLEEEEWGKVIDVNFKGIWRVGREAALRMKGRNGGVIINTASIYARCTGIMKTDYNVSKVAVEQLTKNMALELARSGIRVNALCPGYFATGINDKEFQSERGQAYIKKLVPQRLGKYHELDGPLLLLASDAGSFINGTSLVVDGGTLLSPI